MNFRFCVLVLVALFSLASCSTRRPQPFPMRSRYERFRPPDRIAFAWPVKRVKVSSYYGWRRGGKLHDGLDLTGPRGEKIYASEAGRVIQRGYIRGYGHTVIIDHGEGWSTLYAHLSRYDVGRGQIVQQGQLIGRMGRTGRASGTHLHFELRYNADPLDPLPLLPRIH